MLSDVLCLVLYSHCFYIHWYFDNFLLHHFNSTCSRELQSPQLYFS